MVASLNRFSGQYVFVAGLHRTGTSLLARLVSAHPDVCAITGSPAPENEGCYLQGAIAHTALHGRPGHFATDPAQHLIEGCQYDTLATRTRMEADWDRWFAGAGPWRLEKSPVNLTRMRLYQQLFPLAHFVVVVRHPAKMAAALAKWSDADPAALVDYALDAYDLVMQDLAYLHAAMIVRYEDLARPGFTPALHRFLDLDPIDTGIAIRDGNADYPGSVALTGPQAARAAQFGYTRHGTTDAFEPIVRHPLRHVRDQVWAEIPANQTFANQGTG